MISRIQSSQPANPSILWPSFIQLIFSLLAAFILFGLAAVIFISAAFPFFTSGHAPSDPTGSFMAAASLVFSGALVLPSAWYAWKSIALPETEPSPRHAWRGFGMILTIAVVALEAAALWLGNWVSQNNRLPWLALPLLNIIATGLPALWLVYVGTHGLIPGVPRRRWGVFASGLVLGPLVILVLELIVLALVGVLALLWVMLNPSLANQLNGLIYRLQTTGPNLDTLTRLLAPFLLNPGVIFLGFAFISVLVPLLEELLKPIGVWLLAGQKLTPAQGFGYGVLSGAGFGLFENLGNTSGGATDWALLASSRISTLLLHSFTAGLVGWALVSAWSERRYLRLAITYAVAVIVHGLWNGLALLSVLATLQGISDVTLPSTLQQLETISIAGIVALGVVVLMLFFGANAIFRRATPAMTRSVSQVGHVPSSTEENLLSLSLEDPSQLHREQAASDETASGDNSPGDTTGLPRLDHNEKSNSGIDQ